MVFLQLAFMLNLLETINLRKRMLCNTIQHLTVCVCTTASVGLIVTNSHVYEMSQVGNVIWGRKTIPEGRVAVHIKKLTMLPGILIVPKKKKKKS